MSATETRTQRRIRLATNDNETLVDTPITADDDTEGHRLVGDEDGTSAPTLRRATDESEDGGEMDALSARRLRHR